MRLVNTITYAEFRMPNRNLKLDPIVWKRKVQQFIADALGAIV